MSARCILASAMPALLLWAVPAQAAGCTVNPQDLTFGRYDPFSNAPSETVATISVSCDAETAFEIAIGAGTGSFSGRTMTAGPDVMAYNLYIDPQRTMVWGDGTGGSNTVSAVSAHGDYPIYARAPARQNLTPGTYVDIVSVTITY